jgi:CTP:molybdopterin cytidylyltransferase MocA
VDWAAAAIESAAIAPRAAVIQPGDDAVRGVVEARGFQIVENPRSEEGMGTSIAAGATWARAEGIDGVLVALGDAPFVTAKLLSQLAARFAQLAGRFEASPWKLNYLPPVFALDGCRPASPAVVGRRFFDDLVRLEGDQGARSLLAGVATGIPCSPGELDDIDTPEALEAARRRLRA